MKREIQSPAFTFFFSGPVKEQKLQKHFIHFIQQNK